MKPLETGAPANAKLLETHAADAERNVVRIKDEIEKQTGMLAQADGSDEQTRRIQNTLASLREHSNDAYELWFKLSKQVREYDKAVDTSRREGEKIPRADVEEFFRQFDLSIVLAIESYIISLSQDATRAESPEQFYQAHADNIRSCRVAAIEKAQQDNKLPKWALIE
jgi:vacuolar-type H+-ATPase subunit I/STV1